MGTRMVEPETSISSASLKSMREAQPAFTSIFTDAYPMVSNKHSRLTLLINKMATTSQTSIQKKHRYLRASTPPKWGSYPLNLLGYDVAEVDLGAYHARMNVGISRMVADVTKLQVLTIKHPIDSRG